MRKKCVLDASKLCNDCGDCYKCDLNPNKLCNNCGKCLELQGIDLKAIKIDEILDDKEENNESNRDFEEVDKISLENYKNDEFDFNNFSEEEIEQLKSFNKKLKEEGINLSELLSESDERVVVQYIDDIQGLEETLDDKDILNKKANELYPGFIRFKDKK